ncbi:MAG TPA: cellulose binding domain-containing protein [Bacillota bacterium]|nr:cellulose binding domain-containing protein [Bacillota bacterium]
MADFTVLYINHNLSNHNAVVSATVTNNTAAIIQTWELAWDFTGDQTITDMHTPDTYQQNGTHITVYGPPYQYLWPNGAQNITFDLTFNNSNYQPKNFTLNGRSCEIRYIND